MQLRTYSLRVTCYGTLLPRSDRCGKGLTACQNTAVTQSPVMFKLAHGGNMFASQVLLYNAYDWHRHNIPFTAMQQDGRRVEVARSVQRPKCTFALQWSTSFWFLK